MRILEKNGVDNTNIDGAGFNRFCAGDRDGIIKGRLNECAIAVQGNTLTVGTGELLVSGFRVVLDAPMVFTMSSAPTVAQRYQLIAEVSVDGNSEPTFDMRTQLVTELKQNPIFATASGNGVYQVELCTFTHATNGNIEDLLRTIDIITGGSGTGNGAGFEIGNITTHTLDAGFEAEVDVEMRTEDKKTYVDFRFAVPQGAQGVKGEKGNEISTITSGEPATIGEKTYTTLTFKMTDGSSKTVDIGVNNGKNGTNGVDGTDGVNGNDGADGVGIVDITARRALQQKEGYTTTEVNVQRTDGVIDSFYVDAQNGRDGTDGLNGSDGVGIADITSGEPTESDGFTVTPITIHKTEGEPQVISVKVKNGKDGGTTVVANPDGAGTENLTKIEIDGKIYVVSTGGGSSGGSAPVLLWSGNWDGKSELTVANVKNYATLLVSFADLGYAVATRGLATDGNNTIEVFIMDTSKIGLIQESGAIYQTASVVIPITVNGIGISNSALVVNQLSSAQGTPTVMVLMLQGIATTNPNQAITAIYGVTPIPA